MQEVFFLRLWRTYVGKRQLPQFEMNPVPAVD